MESVNRQISNFGFGKCPMVTESLLKNILIREGRRLSFQIYQLLIVNISTQSSSELRVNSRRVIMILVSLLDIGFYLLDVVTNVVFSWEMLNKTNETRQSDSEDSNTTDINVSFCILDVTVDKLGLPSLNFSSFSARSLEDFTTRIMKI